VDEGPPPPDDGPPPADEGTPPTATGPPPPAEDGDTIGDDVDNCPDIYNKDQSDIDGDGKGDLCDDDTDNDGLSDEEELTFGSDCSLTDPKSADTDGDSIADIDDAYPKDPFPAFITLENGSGSISVILSAGGGDFGEPFNVGKPLGHVCAAADKNCNPGCAAGELCSDGACVTEEPDKCDPGCADGMNCRHLLYRGISIADFDADGKMDFIAHSWPAHADGTHELWFFRRLAKEGDFPQQLLGTVESFVQGPVADINGDFYFDIVHMQTIKIPKGGPGKENFIGDVLGTSYLGNGIDDGTPCAVGATAEDGCAFVRVDDSLDLESEVFDQWGNPRAREAQDLNGDELNDLVVGTYPNGGNSVTTVYMLPSNGDGTFGTPEILFKHNLSKSQSPTNSMVFADFDGDTQGDVLMGLDDDGDAGAAWLYLGAGGGKFSGSSTKVIDINPGCDSGCADKVGVTGNAKGFDFNFDGAMDVILGFNYVQVWAPPSKIVIFFGEGDGTFKPEKQVGPDLSSSARFQAPQRLCPWYKP